MEMFGTESHSNRSPTTNSHIQSISDCSDCVSHSDSLDIFPIHINDDEVQISNTIDNRNELPEVMLFKNTSAFCQELRLIPEMAELCDVKFLVGEDKVPVYGVKAILVTRSITFFQMILFQQKLEKRELIMQQKKWKLFSKLRKLPMQCKKPKGYPPSTSSSGHLTIDIMNFDLDTFRTVMVYLHSGHVSANVHSVIGLMNAANSYGLKALRSACFHFACRCINLQTVLQLFTAARSYSSFKWTKSILTKIFDFIDENADCVLRLPSFENVSKEIAILILTRPELRVSEETKWDAALKWSRRYCEAGHSHTLTNTLRFFTPRINFCEIPLPKLTKEIHPLTMLSEHFIDRAIESNSGPRKEQMSSASVNPCLTRHHSVQSLNSVSSGESVFGEYFSRTQGFQSIDSGLSVCSSENSSLLSNIW